jgi:hypothetical protein
MQPEMSAGTSGREVDNLSFAVRARKFRIHATVMRRTSIALATEFGLRLVHLVSNLTAEDLGAFFGFSGAETRVLVEDLLDSGLVEVGPAGAFRLSQRGLDAVSPMSDTLEVFELDEIRVVPSFDLVAFAPIDDAELGGDVARLLDELPIPDRERASRSAAAARDAFELHFEEWKQQHGRRYGLDDDTRVYLTEDVQPVRTFGAALSVPVRYRPGESGVVPDFSELFSRGRTGSRDALVNALRSRIQQIPVANDFNEAFALIEEIDGGLFRRSGCNSPLQQDAWASLASDDIMRALPSSSGPGLRLVGTTACEDVRTALLEWSRGMPTLADPIGPPVPVLWLPPMYSHWGRSLSFARTAKGLSDTYETEGGTVLLARTDNSSKVRRTWERLYGRKGEIAPLFDRCMTVAERGLPRSLEIIMRPCSWVMILIHAPDPKSGLPFPLGYVTAAPDLVERYKHLLAELVAQSPNSAAFLWTAPDEDAAKALAVVDLALSIQAG